MSRLWCSFNFTRFTTNSVQHLALCWEAFRVKRIRASGSSINKRYWHEFTSWILAAGQQKMTYFYHNRCKSELQLISIHKNHIDSDIDQFNQKSIDLGGYIWPFEAGSLVWYSSVNGRRHSNADWPNLAKHQCVMVKYGEIQKAFR